MQLQGISYSYSCGHPLTRGQSSFEQFVSRCRAPAHMYTCIEKAHPHLLVMILSNRACYGCSIACLLVTFLNANIVLKSVCWTDQFGV